MNEMRRRIQHSLLTLVGLWLFGGLASPGRLDAAGAIGMPLAQAGGAAQLPSNSKKVGRLYVMESIVVAALFGGAIYAVCRTSRRT